jgi:hypothetical protein
MQSPAYTSRAFLLKLKSTGMKFIVVVLAARVVLLVIESKVSNR